VPYNSLSVAHRLFRRSTPLPLGQWQHVAAGTLRDHCRYHHRCRVDSPLAVVMTFCVRLLARGMIRWQQPLLLRPLNAAASRRATHVKLRRQARFSDVAGLDYGYHIVGCVGPDQTYRASTEAAAHHPCPKAAGA